MDPVNSVTMPDNHCVGHGRLLKWLGWSLVVVVADQFSKYLAGHYLELHEPVAVLPLVNLTLAHNTGAAFSFLSSASGWQRWFFVILALCVSTIILFWLKRLPVRQSRQAMSLSLILGGALGNVWDRIQFGYVIDFIDLYYDRWHWPVFNIADSAITAGAVLLIIDTLISRKQR